METALLAKHQGRAHKLAIEPGSPHIFYTCGEDGLVQHVSYFVISHFSGCRTLHFCLLTQVPFCVENLNSCSA